MTDDSYLRLAGIHKSFGKFVALQDIALDVRRGELMVFLGPSGCGKTTLLRIIAGLETQNTGTIQQDGRDISRLPAIRRDYGIVFQSYALFPNLTIYANVAYGLVNRRQGRAAIAARVAELLKLIGLPDAGANTQDNSPAASSSGSHSRARWPPRPVCCCWTNRCRRWTPSSGCGCAGKFARCSSGWA